MDRVFTTSRRYIARLAALVVLGLVLALVTGSGSLAAPGSTINIAPKAFVYDFGFLLEAQVTVNCTGGPGSISMTVTQSAADSGNGVGATGGTFFFFESANCDGTSHKVDVTIFAFAGQFDVGRASASATLSAPSGTATDSRTIEIITV